MQVDTATSAPGSRSSRVSRSREGTEPPVDKVVSREGFFVYDVIAGF